MAEVHWGVDGRTHRVGDNGQTLCRTMIDYSRPPVERVFSGCEVCDIVRAGSDGPGTRSTGRGFVLALAAAGVLSLLVWTAVR
jgi:hypothetical protein